MLTVVQCDLAKEGFCQDKNKMDQFCEEFGFCGWYGAVRSSQFAVRGVLLWAPVQWREGSLLT